MRVGFDLDKVFINTPPFIPEILIERFYKKKLHGNPLYRIPSYPEQLLRRFSHIPIFRPPIEENIAFLSSNVSKKENFFLISSRFKFLSNATNRIMQYYGLSKLFEHMHFNTNNEQPHIFKERLLKELQIERFVDDDYQLLHFLAKRNPNILFFWYNKKNTFEKLSSNLYAISHLSDIINDKIRS